MYSTRQGIGLSNVVRETIHPKGKGSNVHASLSRGRVVYFQKSPNEYKKNSPSWLFCSFLQPNQVNISTIQSHQLIMRANLHKLSFI